MNIKFSSFDIFDTCLIRKCGTPENFFDVLSLRVFKSEVEEQVRQEFVAARYNAEQSLQQYSAKYSLKDIWNAFDWSHSQLYPKDSLLHIEIELEREMLVPVLNMVDVVKKCRQKGNKIAFISDMYLPSAFLIEQLSKYGFYQEGDSIYVSGECGVRKSEGNLYQYVAEKEDVKYKNWEHYGDNLKSDYEIPKKIGIQSHLVFHDYTPYQACWYNNDNEVRFHYASILAGIGRSLHYREEWTSHTDLVLDIIAPYYCSMVWRMMSDAYSQGIRRLYFCARDTYMMYKIADLYKQSFPQMSIDFLYISKQALYHGDEKAKEAYFKQIGLATKTEKVAIVDVRSTGKTMEFLNNWLSQHGYNQVRGYYYELFVRRDEVQYSVKDYYCEVNAMYIEHFPQMTNLLRWWKLQEQYFPLNTLERTINYEFNAEGVSAPVFDKNEAQTPEDEKWTVTNIEQWSKYHEKLMLLFAKDYVSLHLGNYSDGIFQNIVCGTLNRFFASPDKHYLMPLTELFVSERRNNMILQLPYVKKEPIWKILLHRTRGSSLWTKATIVYSIPGWMTRIWKLIKEK